jgi:CRISPR-associated endoribonuclease Cas6
MRIHLTISKPEVPVPFNHQHKIVGAIHKWLGVNEEHGNLSLYSFSQLQKGRVKDGKLVFPYATGLFISSYDGDFLKRSIEGIWNDPEIAYGMKVTGIIFQEDPDLSTITLFHTASPILVKNRVDDKIKHYHYSEEETARIMTDTMRSKMKRAGMPEDPELSIRFDNKYPRAKTQLIDYKGIKNRANRCPVLVQGSPETKQFVWNVGIGNSTGIGFGALK